MDDTTLRCPRCHQALERAHDIHVCRACRGGFVADTVLYQMVAAHPGAEVRYRPRGGQTLACPGCAGEMLAVAIEDVPVDRCVPHGLWFDADELGETVARTASRARKVTTHSVEASDTDVVVSVLDVGGEVALSLVDIVLSIFDAA